MLQCLEVAYIFIFLSTVNVTVFHDDDKHANSIANMALHDSFYSVERQCPG